jgi:deoxyribodipyrimidine photolyase-like uncharacterized protein
MASSSHFPALFRYMPHYVDGQTAKWVSACALNEIYDVGAGHHVQRLPLSSVTIPSWSLSRSAKLP